MKRILDYIEQKKQELAQSPFLRFLEDSSLTARQRFTFVPCIAPFAMAFGDLNKYILRDEASEHPLQKIINAHSQQDDHHWRMYLKDLQTLGMNASMDLVSVLNLLWGEDRKKTRQLVYGLTTLIKQAEPELRMVVVEAVEATGSVASRRFSTAASEFQREEGKELYYFGPLHERLETGHAVGTENVEATLAAIEMRPEQEEAARVLVDKVFGLFSEMFDELLAYAQSVLGEQQGMTAARLWKAPRTARVSPQA